MREVVNSGHNPKAVRKFFKSSADALPAELASLRFAELVDEGKDRKEAFTDAYMIALGLS